MADKETEMNPREVLHAAREKRRLRLIEGQPPTTVTVYAANDDVGEILRHPNGVRFRPGEGAEWPNDSFTARRIADGSVSTEAGSGGDAPKPDPTHNARQQAAAGRSKAKAEAEKPKPKAKTEPQPAPQPAPTT